MCVCSPDCTRTTRVLEFLHVVCTVEVNESTYLWFNIELYLLFTTMYTILYINIHALHGTLVQHCTQTIPTNSFSAADTL
jgi:hypothetical protein